MEEYQLRVIEEEKIESAKLLRLRTFIKSDTFLRLDADTQTDLISQADIMSMLVEILNLRISKF